MTDVSELQEKVWALIAESVPTGPTLDEVRGVLNDVGLRRARAAVAEAPAQVAKAKDAYRQLKAEVDVVRDEYTQAVLEAEWVLDERFVVEGNKTWLLGPCPHIDHPDHEQQCSCDHGEIRKAMTADERKAWKAAEARKLPAVAGAAQALAEAEERCASARDDISHAEDRWSAARHELDAAIAELSALALALGANR